jgi:hypothetical protein
VDLSGEVSVFAVGGDESHEDQLTGESEELWDFRDSSDVFGSGFSGET